jgi:hypothetical protein
VDTLGSFALLPIGFAFTGWLIDRIGVTSVFLAAGGITALISLLPLMYSVIRKLD